jgi:hypothetical protein
VTFKIFNIIIILIDIAAQQSSLPPCSAERHRVSSALISPLGIGGGTRTFLELLVFSFFYFDLKKKEVKYLKSYGVSYYNLQIAIKLSNEPKAFDFL